MAAKRPYLATGARIVTGVVVAAVAVVAAGAALALPLPAVTVQPSAFTVDPAPAEAVRACAGPLVRLSDDSGQDATAISGVGSAQVVAASDDSTVSLDRSSLASPDDRTTTESTAPQRVGLTPSTSSADTLFAAAQSQTVASGDLVGLAAVACGEASAESWLVAGSTTVGRTSFVSLANGGDVAAVVDLSLYGDQGPIASPGAKNLDVPARSTRIVSLAGLAPDQADPVVHVVASVGSVTATVQQSVVRGLEPGGVEVVGATAQPSTSQTVPGVQISGTSAIAEKLADPDYSDLTSVLRLLAPGDQPASVTLRIAEQKDGGAQTEYQVGLTPGIVTEFPLQDVPDGTYTVTADSDQPIVMGARTSTLANGVTDFAWYQAVLPLDPTFFVSVANGPNPQLSLVNGGSEPVDVTWTALDGGVGTATIPVGARAVPLQAGMSYTVTASGPVSGALGLSGDGLLASYAIEPPSPAAAPVVVYP